MNICYQDILSRIKEKPLWFDENAVPRYCKFSPDTIQIYTDEVALLKIQCQACNYEFHVAISKTKYHSSPRIKELIETND